VAEQAPGRLPDFLIPGEARCGSTTLFSLLSGHPDVFFPSEKELHYFSSYRLEADAERERARLLDYRAQFAGAAPHQRCGEATPNYLFDAGACARVRTLIPRVRLLVILRDPVARAWSHYWHQVRRGRETLGFEQALEAEASRIDAGDPLARSRFSYLSRGRYVESLVHWEQAFTREPICVLFLEELQRDTEATLARVCAHLGIPPEPLAQARLPHANQAAFPRWPRLASLGQALRRRAGAAGPGVEAVVRRLGRLTRPLRVYSGAPRMPESTRRALRESLRASDLELAAWLGRPLPWSAEATSPRDPRGG
jgi:hypothetical protein